jgi:hypothetical protein
MTKTAPHPYRVGDTHPSAHPLPDGDVSTPIYVPEFDHPHPSAHPPADADDVALALLVELVDEALRGHDIPKSDLGLIIGEALFQVARLVRLGAVVELPELGMLRRQPMPGKTARVEFRPHPSLLREFPDAC